MPTDPTEIEILIPECAVVRAEDLASAVIMLGECGCGGEWRLLRYDPLRATRRWTAVWGGDGTHLGERGDGDTPLAAVMVLLSRLREVPDAD